MIEQASKASLEAPSPSLSSPFTALDTRSYTMSLFSQSGVSLSHMEKLSSQTIQQTIDRALELLDHPDWKQGKTFTEDHVYQVQTAKLHATGAEKLPWHKRKSLHPVDRDITYEDFRNGLLLDHTTNEQQYIPDMKYCNKVKTFREELPEVEVYLIQVRLFCCSILIVQRAMRLLTLTIRTVQNATRNYKPRVCVVSDYE